MASLSISPSFHTLRSKTTIQDVVNPMNHRTRPTFVACQTRVPFDPPTDQAKGGKEKKQSMMEVFVGVKKLGRGFKESLSPKRKGDWKDLVLMSLSFAIYVYISQKIVCAYCAWMHVFEHHW
ncbi:hypothetical protein HanRHA438_Chr01g0026141 [Helianthus annuus]|uniref:Uncharacterized protein n=1 Tax=Helianthus annuus TaxID=4232 RepID=A0A251VNT0_HELAN|nr:hypothetical protein HanXRQr2_Chr01g0025741 [Helianthus annuus]KAJ0623078.1 hypothetical protein HanIR_Chr01g0027831 [Helianthus annuus]KAJ0627211.1 hypothetical protein HanHA89_Chr01g0022771 [Helianthus annuus]KAJ0948344.1 hypothetical protein HanRHA438_Chr01g0026141 [Helianthus annuus]KAJ0957233.1 hypothetical protein HanPSC8_Chr01g0024861 [Helianthus annuus]